MKENDPSKKQSCIIVLLILILIALLFLVFILWRTGLIPIDLFPISDNSTHITASVERSFSNEEEVEYTQHPFLPFEFTFSVPADWFVGTTELGGDPSLPRCLTYHLLSPGEFARIEIMPMCGDFGGGFVNCPETMKHIGDISNQPVGRYPASAFYSNRPGLVYSTYRPEDNFCFELVSNTTIFMKITAYYNGPDSEWPRYLEEIDKIVLSLSN